MDDAALKYLTHWGYKIGTPEAEAAWEEKQRFDRGYRAFATPMVFVSPNICYDSPIDGRPITSMQARIEDLKRSGCMEYDPEMRKDTIRRQQEADAELEKSVDSFVEQQFEAMPARKKESLAAELESGVTTEIVRKTHA